MDLRDAGAVQDVYDVVTDGSARVLAAIALNAGIGRAGRFVDGDLQADLDIVDVNVRSTCTCAKFVLTIWQSATVAGRFSPRRSWR